MTIPELELHAAEYRIGELEHLLTLAQASTISGFYEELVPTFRQGMPTHELEELVSAEEVTRYVARIQSLRKLLAESEGRVRWLEAELRAATRGQHYAKIYEDAAAAKGSRP